MQKKFYKCNYSHGFSANPLCLPEQIIILVPF